MIGKSVDNLIRDLLHVVSDLSAHHSDLAVLMRDKLDAMRRADSDAIQRIGLKEGALLERITEREGLRRQLTRHVAEAVGVGEDITTLRLTTLAESLSEPRRSQLLAASTGLKQKLGEVEQLRVTTTLVTQHLLSHMGEVLNVMRGDHGVAQLYSASGRRQEPSAANVFEAVG